MEIIYVNKYDIHFCIIEITLVSTHPQVKEHVLKEADLNFRN